jgi:hypothetical protein
MDSLALPKKTADKKQYMREYKRKQYQETIHIIQEEMKSKKN